MPSQYYEKSLEIGKKFQKENSSWNGTDCKNYHNQIRVLMDLHNASTVLDYGCGKGAQYENLVQYGMPDNSLTDPMTFQTRINAKEVYKYDPCVEKFSVEPIGMKFDAVICTQVLGSIPDADLDWVKEKLMGYATKFVFIGLHDPYKPVKSKKRIYDQNLVTYPRSVEWYQDKFSNWQGPKLYWWFRNYETPVNQWYLNAISDKAN